MKILLLLLFLSPVGFAEDTAVPVKVLSPNLLLVNGRRVYLPEITVKIVDENSTNQFLSIKLSGVTDWNTDTLKAFLRCQEGEVKTSYVLPKTNLPEVWSIPKKLCSQMKGQFCLADKSNQVICSPFYDRDSLSTEVGQNFNSIDTSWTKEKPFVLEVSGRGYKLNWKPEYLEKLDEDDSPIPTLFLSALVGAVGTQDSILPLGSAQAVYWPRASRSSSLDFDPQRIGAQIRHSRSLTDESISTGKKLDLSWTDISLNYRRNPQSIFNGFHVYGVVSTSLYSALGQTINRVGGGFAVSHDYPNPFLGIKYPGKLYSYLDFQVLPLDTSGDNLGIAVSSKANGIWLIGESFFLTGDLELRLINFSLGSENSILRPQLGFGWAF